MITTTIISVTPYEPEHADILWRAGVCLSFSSGKHPSLEDVQIIPLSVISPMPWAALDLLGIQTLFLREESAYQCPYTKHDCFGIIPVAVLSTNVEKYRAELQRKASDHDVTYWLDFKWHRGRLIHDHEAKANLPLTAIQKQLLGPGYTHGTLISDGSGAIKPGTVKLFNNDSLYVYFWEWYNK